MIAATIAAVCIAAILLFSEIIWKKFNFRDELARKSVHISTGVFIAFLPYWVDYFWIMVLAVGFITVNLLNRKIDTFHAIHSVRRKSWGDVLFGVGVFAVAFLQPAPWIFTVAILQVSLADGLAALAGVTYGKKHGRYYLFTQPKSIIGSVVFLVSSAVIITAGFVFSDYIASAIQLWPVIIILPLLLMCVENLAVFGFDNLALPLATIAVLGLL